MKVAVIGGSGFIGSHVVDKLMEAGHEVTILDIMAPHRRDVRHIVIDVMDLGRTTVALAGEYDAIYMQAAVANVNDVFHIPIESMQLNVMAVGHVLEAARRTGAKRVILASTTWVYGMAAEEDVDETTLLAPEKANHVYTASKLSAEMLCHAYQELYKVDSTILRYGIPYGPRARMGTVLATFVRRAMDGKPLIIHGDGRQWRRFVYVEDLALGNVLALQEEAANQIYNVDGVEDVTVRQIAEKVAAAFRGTDVSYVDARSGDYAPKRVSSEKARRELGWSPRVSFNEGADRYIQWCLEQRERAAIPAQV